MNQAIVANAIVILLVAAAIVAIVCYLMRAKKRGETCIGCPYAKQCGGHCSGGCGGAQTGRQEHK